jgi:hypothetical protein
MRFENSTKRKTPTAQSRFFAVPFDSTRNGRYLEVAAQDVKYATTNPHLGVYQETLQDGTNEIEVIPGRKQRVSGLVSKPTQQRQVTKAQTGIREGTRKNASSIVPDTKCKFIGYISPRVLMKLCLH